MKKEGEKSKRGGGNLDCVGRQKDGGFPWGTSHSSWKGLAKEPEIERLKLKKENWGNKDSTKQMGSPAF